MPARRRVPLSWWGLILANLVVGILGYLPQLEALRDAGVVLCAALVCWLFTRLRGWQLALLRRRRGLTWMASALVIVAGRHLGNAHVRPAFEPFGLAADFAGEGFWGKRLR